jgi:Carboxypeptidase regulatory-like domain
VTIATASRRHIRLLFVACVALVVGTLLALGMSAAPAHATPAPVAFTVKLTNKTGTALTSYTVYAIGVLNGTELPDDTPAVGAPVSGKPGSYSMSLTSGEQYTLFFVPTGASATSGTVQYLGGTPILAEASTFTPSATNTFLAASIATGGTIVGTVTGPTGAVLSGAEVDEYEYDGSKWFSNNYTITNSHGQYSFTNVDPGSYKFEFYAPLSKYPPIFSGSQTTLSAAHSVFIAAGAAGTVNQKFAVGTGSISGTAQYVDEGSSAVHARPGVVAGAFPVTGTAGNLSIDDDKAVYGAAANSNGQWSIGGLLPGAYVVQLQPGYFGEAANYIGAAGDNTAVDNTALQQAAILTVVAGQKTAAPTSVVTVNDDADGASPEITVQDWTGATLSGMKVQITQTTNPIGVVVSGTSTSNGTVQLSYGDAAHTTVGPIYNQSSHVLPLAPSYYTVTVIAPNGNYEPYNVDQYLGFGDDPQIIKLDPPSPSPAFTSDPVITETATIVGTTYHVTGAVANRSNALTYQWLRDGRPIYGATATSYQSVGADVDSQLSVRVTDSEFGFDPVYAVADVGGDSPEPVTPGDQPQVSGQPTITPTAPDYVGTTLQARAGQWSIDGSPTTGLSYSYVWKRDGIAIAHATGLTYVVQPADLNDLITVTVQASKPGYGTSTPATSAPATPLAKPGVAATKAPVVTAKLVHGVTTYSVNSGSWNTTGLTFSYVWSVGGVLVSTQASVTSTTVDAAIGGTLPAADPLTVVVTANKTNYLPVSSGPVAAVKGTFAFAPADGSNLAVTDQTGTPTVVNDSSDPLKFGDRLQVTTAPTWAPILHGVVPYLPSGMKYQWYRNSDGVHTVAIAGATASSYTVGAADLNSTDSTVLSVVATPVSNYYAAVQTAPFVVGHAVHLNFSSAPSVVVTGKLAVGQTVTAKISGSWGTTGVTGSYQWYYCPKVATSAAPACTDENDITTYDVLKGATKSTLPLLSSYDAVMVRYRGSKSGYTVVSIPSVPVGISTTSPVQLDLVAPPTIAGLTGGQAHVGVKLSITGFTYNVPVTLSYDWQQQQCVPGSCLPNDWTSVPSLVGHSQTSTYTPTVADFAAGGETIRVVLDGTSIHNPSSSASANSPEYVLGYGAAKLTTAPTLATATSSFTVKPGTYSIKGAAQSVVWYENGAPFGPVTPTVWPRTGSDAGKAIYADVTYSVPGYQPVTTRLVAQKGSTMTAPGESITGSRYGDTLGLSNAQPFDDALHTTRTLSYQWYSNGTAISGQTHSTFKPSSAYINHKIQVRVAGKSSLYVDGVVTPQLTLGSGAFTTPSTPNIGFTGSLTPGTVMTAVPANNYGTTGITFTYQWQRRANSGAAWSNIAKATSVHYTPVATDVTQQLQVIVTATKSGYTSLGAASSVADVHYSTALAVFVPPALVPTGGTVKVGALVTVAPGAWNTPGLSYSYAWYVGDSSAAGILIPGVTGSSWTPTPTTYGDDITVAVTASRAGYVPVTVDSATVTVGLGAAATALVAPVITKSGSTYTVSPGSWNLDGLTFTYDWRVGDQEGAGTGGYAAMTYKPAVGEHGALTLHITAIRGGYAQKVIILNGPTL